MLSSIIDASLPAAFAFDAATSCLEVRFDTIFAVFFRAG
jgi:hypothetical protein